MTPTRIGIGALTVTLTAAALTAPTAAALTAPTVAAPAAAPVAAPAAAPVACQMGSGTVTNFTHAGIARSYKIVVPPGATSATPVVVSIHGATGNADIMERTTGFSQATPAPIVIYPNATGTSPQTFWDASPGGRDVDYLATLITSVHNAGCGSPATTSVNGFSMGAMMTSRLLCYAPQLFTSAGMVGGILPPTPGCTIPKAMNIVMVHGTSDSTVPYDGTIPNPALVQLMGGPDNGYFPGVTRTRMTELWHQAKGCTLQGNPIARVNDATRLTTVYPACDGAAITSATALKGAGHTWNTPNFDTTSYLWTMGRPEANLTPIDNKWRSLGGNDSIHGPARSPITNIAGGRVKYFTNGAIYETAQGVHSLYGSIWGRYQQLGAERGPLGLPVTSETGDIIPGARKTIFTNGAIYWTYATGAHDIYGAIWARYRSLPPHEQLTLGPPITPEIDTATAGGRKNIFRGGSIMWSRGTGAHAIYGDIWGRYQRIGAERSPLGLPVTSETGDINSGARKNIFTNGAIYWSPNAGSHDIYGAIWARYRSLPPHEQLTLGPPITPEIDTATAGGRKNIFRGGSIMWSRGTGAHAIYGDIWGRYQRIGAERSPLGLPVTSETGDPVAGVRKNMFQSGAIYWTPKAGSSEVYGAIWARYRALGESGSKLGLPISGELSHYRGRKSVFENGTIYWSGIPGAYTPPSGVIVAINPQPPTAQPNTDGVPVAANTLRKPQEFIAETVVGWGKRFLWWWKSYGMVPWTSLPQSVRTAGDGGPARDATISGANTIAVDGKGGYYLADTGNNLIRHVDRDGVMRTVVGNGSLKPDPSCAYNRPARQVCLNVPHGVSVDPRDGGLIITDSFNQVITKMGRDGFVRLLAGNGQICNPDRSVSECGEGGPATSARIDRPIQSRMTEQGLYIADSHNRILLVGADGVMRRVAGTGDAGFSGDEGPATSARLWAPADMVPYRGGLLISDGNNCRLRWVDPKGVIHAFAGYEGDIHACWASYGEVQAWGKPRVGTWGDQLTGNIGDGGSALYSRMTVTGLLAVDGDVVYVTDFLNNSVRRISDGVIDTVLGWTPKTAIEVDGPVPGRQYPIVWTSGIDYDPVSGSVYVAGGGRGTVVKLTPVKPSTPTPTPTQTVEPTPTQTVEPTPTQTVEPTPTQTVEPTPTARN